MNNRIYVVSSTMTVRSAAQGSGVYVAPLHRNCALVVLPVAQPKTSGHQHCCLDLPSVAACLAGSVNFRWDVNTTCTAIADDQRLGCASLRNH